MAVEDKTLAPQKASANTVSASDELLNKTIDDFEMSVRVNARRKFLREPQRRYSQGQLPGSGAFIAAAVLALLLALAIVFWPDGLVLPRLVRALLLLLAATALGAIGRSFFRSSHDALAHLGLALRDLAAGRIEVRAPEYLPGISGDLARDLNRLAQQYAELRSGLDGRVAEQTLRLKRERDQFAQQSQQLRAMAAREQEELRAQSERLSSMSHELRTPLSGILGYADLLRRTPLDTEQLEHLETLDKSARALLTMINDLLDWSRIEAGRLKLDDARFDLCDTIESTVALLAPLAYEKDLELVRIVYHDVPAELRGDGQRLRQILTNLLSNAIKFTAQGAVVLRVMGEREEYGCNWLRFAVSDTGPGIAADQRARLFQPFRQVGVGQAGSSGLGLSITRKLTVGALDVQPVQIHPRLVAGDGEDGALDHGGQHFTGHRHHLALCSGRRFRDGRELARIQSNQAKARAPRRDLDPVVVLRPDANLPFAELAHHLEQLARTGGEAALLAHRRHASPPHRDLLIRCRDGDAVAAGTLDEHVAENRHRRAPFGDALHQVQTGQQFVPFDGEFHSTPA